MEVRTSATPDTGRGAQDEAAAAPQRDDLGEPPVLRRAA
jgi:hypothetical protein